MSNVTIQIDLEAPVPIYRQIVDAVRACIVEGRVKPGDRLPTVRELAVNLAIHHNTVAQAYRELAEEGWLDLGRGRGATVMERRRPASTGEIRSSFAHRLRELIAKAYADGLTDSEISAILSSAISERKDT